MALRIGILGAARIVRDALVVPARRVDGVRVSAIAARDPERARALARKHGIERVHGTYENLLADPEIDAVYLPLPAALHARWTLAAMEAGKHVLVEKPFTSNAAAALEVAAHANRVPTVVMEAYHSHFHPLHTRLKEILQSGELGSIRSARATFCVPIPPGRDIRWNLALGGGGLLDVGYYPVRMLRELLDPSPTVQSARAWMRGEIDRLIVADLDLGGVQGRVVAGMWSLRLGMGFEVTGDAGRLRVSFPYHPHLGTKIRVNGLGGRRVELTDSRSTYAYQLDAFRDAAFGARPVETDASAAVAQMSTLDAIYASAGMSARP